MPYSVERSFYAVKLDKCPVSLAKPASRCTSHYSLIPESSVARMSQVSGHTANKGCVGHS